MSKLEKARKKRERKAARGSGFAAFDPHAWMVPELKAQAAVFDPRCETGAGILNTAHLLEEGKIEPAEARRAIDAFRTKHGRAR